ncbi:hypothetical protein ABH908_000237 [Pseudomonas frederiksbergensis]|uniref:hypothetical protein n=1 Tax=Pseudomonas TaxID=286 RepID=UPI003D1A7C37
MTTTTKAAPTKKPTLSQLRQQRCINANEFLQVIANCGRNFFRNTGSGHDGYLTMNERSTIVWFHDDFTSARLNVSREGYWDGFSHGGTLKSLLGSVGKHILTGKTMRYGYFQPKMDNGFENPWGYDDDILLVCDAGVRLGLITPPVTGAAQQGKIMNNEQPVPAVTTAVAKDRTVHKVGCPALNERPGCTCNTAYRTLTVAEICQLNDLSVVKAEKVLTNLQEKGLVIGFVPGDVHAQITLTADSAKYFD